VRVQDAHAHFSSPVKNKSWLDAGKEAEKEIKTSVAL